MYQVLLLDEAKDDLRKLQKKSKDTAQLVAQKLKWLGENAGAMQHQALQVPFAGFYKRHVGDYRIIYKVDHPAKVITVFRIGNRRDVYRA